MKIGKKLNKDIFTLRFKIDNVKIDNFKIDKVQN